MKVGSLKFGTYVLMFKHVPKTTSWFCSYSCGCAC